MLVSKFEKYLVRKPLYEQFSGIKNRQSPAMTYMSSSLVRESGCYLCFSWIYGIPDPNPFYQEHIHPTPEIILYIGGDPENPEDLGGEVEFFMGGQSLVFSSSAALFIPAGIKHGPVIWKKFNKPHIEMTLIPGTGTIDDNWMNNLDIKNPKIVRSERCDLDFEKYLVRKPIYERGSGVKNRQSPTMTFLSSNLIPEADYYIEYGWIFGIPVPNPPVSKHVHAHDELILHFGGDAQNPEDLGGEIEAMVENELLSFSTNTALFAPKGIAHCPMTWKQWHKPHIEMAITLGYGKR